MKMVIVVMAAHISFAVSVFVLTVKKNKRRTAAADLYYLPDECWESIFKVLVDDEGNHHSCSKRLNCLKPLCLVSKQFLSITNRFLRLSPTDDYCYICAVQKRNDELRNQAAAYGGDYHRLDCHRHSCLKRFKYLKPLCLVFEKYPSVANRFIRLSRNDLPCSMCYIEKLNTEFKDVMITIYCPFCCCHPIIATGYESSAVTASNKIAINQSQPLIVDPTVLVKKA